MDVASTKRSIVAAAEAAGLGDRASSARTRSREVIARGGRASRESLFDDARVFLCPTPSDDDRRRCALAESLWRALRARRGGARRGGARRADGVAQPPAAHASSSALALTLREAGVPRSALGPGGRDMTRLAGSSPRLWTAIVRDNARGDHRRARRDGGAAALFRERLAADETSRTRELR